MAPFEVVAAHDAHPIQATEAGKPVRRTVARRSRPNAQADSFPALGNYHHQCRRDRDRRIRPMGLDRPVLVRGDHVS